MPTACDLNYASIDRYARDVGEHYEIYSPEGQANIDELLRILGGKTEIARDDESMFVERQGKFTIYVPRLTSLRRDRFTVAHELGHYFLHYVYAGLNEPTKFTRGASHRMEIEANFFAASLVMPSVPFASQWHRTGGDARELSRVFDVSPRAAEIRATVLGIDSPKDTSSPLSPVVPSALKESAACD